MLKTLTAHIIELLKFSIKNLIRKCLLIHLYSFLTLNVVNKFTYRYNYRNDIALLKIESTQFIQSINQRIVFPTTSTGNPLVKFGKFFDMKNVL